MKQYWCLFCKCLIRRGDARDLGRLRRAGVKKSDTRARMPGGCAQEAGFIVRADLGTAVFAAAAAPTLRRAAAPWSGGVRMRRGAATSSQAATFHVGAPAGAKAASIARDHVTRRAAQFAAAAAPTLRRAAATWSGLRPHAPGAGDILPGRDGSCRSAGRREPGVDCPRPPHPPRRPIRGGRRSYIALSRGDMVRAASACAGGRRHPPGPRRFM